MPARDKDFGIFVQKDVFSLPYEQDHSLTVKQLQKWVFVKVCTMHFFLASQGSQKRPGASSAAVSPSRFLFRTPRLSRLLSIMGCLSSKPATETETSGIALGQVPGALVAETKTPRTVADLGRAFMSMKNGNNEQFESIKTEIGSLKTSIDSNTNAIDRITTELGSIKTDIGSIKTVLLVPDGDSEAKQSTVIIAYKLADTSDYHIIGNGIVVYAPGHSTNAPDEKYYLLSAAHVLIVLAMVMKTEGSSLKLSWLRNDRPTFEERMKGALILHENYISMGSHDYGFMELQSMTKKSLPLHASMEILRLRTPTVGHSVVAHGKVFLRGTVTGQVGTTPRFSVMAHSIPGSSGAPIFNNSRHLVAVVHGSSKHRGHANISMEDDNAAVAYADTIQVNEGLRKISEDHWEWLSLAEAVPPEVASGREVLDIERHVKMSDLWEKLGMKRSKPNGEVTLKDIMDALKAKVDDGMIRTTWDVRSEFKFVSVPDPTSTETGPDTMGLE